MNEEYHCHLFLFLSPLLLLPLLLPSPLAVSLKQVEGLWRPRLGFINTDDIQNTAVDADAVTTIIKLDQSFAPDLSNPYEGG